MRHTLITLVTSASAALTLSAQQPLSVPPVVPLTSIALTPLAAAPAAAVVPLVPVTPMTLTPFAAAPVAAVVPLVPLAPMTPMLFVARSEFTSPAVMPDRAELPGDDPADSLYRAGRDALNNTSNRRAAELFREVRTKYPRSRPAEDAPYWEAFALLRLGTDADLRQAREALDWQQAHFPNAATHGDASALATRIEGRLARNGDTQAVKYIEGRSAAGGCPTEDEDERIDALNALIQMDSERAMPILRTVLARRDACSAGLRKKAVWLVATRKAPDAAEILLNAVNTDPDSEVREQAVFWLASVPSDAATDVLIRLARTGTYSDLRSKAIFALSRSKSARANQALREIALDTSAPAEARADAVQWLLSSRGREGNADAMSFLLAMYPKVTEQSLRDRLLFAAGQMRTTDATDFLLRVARDTRESDETRKQAVFNASRSGATAAQLIQIYDQISGTEVREHVLWVLSNSKDPAGTDKLIDVARSDREPALRKQAIFWLSRSKDARAAKFLLEIIER
ncbi:MAG: HEAT repeat domain-containing protein [Gemmatimonadaceae bacterium]|nr:HEAT repeat domain-containing protein [Gemmatimonadaceae bacterium]